MSGIQRYGTTKRYSHAASHGNTAYLVEVADNLDAGIIEQTKNVLTKVDELLASMGSNKS